MTEKKTTLAGALNRFGIASRMFASALATAVFSKETIALAAEIENYRIFTAAIGISPERAEEILLAKQAEAASSPLTTWRDVMRAATDAAVEEKIMGARAK